MTWKAYSPRPSACFRRCKSNWNLLATPLLGRSFAARSEEGAHSNVDVMVVGSVGTAELVPALKRLERRFGREINVTRYSEEESYRKVRNGDHFLSSLLKEKRVMLKGSAHELAAIAGVT
jgi:predicted nucleotidyltransferase